MNDEYLLEHKCIQRCILILLICSGCWIQSGTRNKWSFLNVIKCYPLAQGWVEICSPHCHCLGLKLILYFIKAWCDTRKVFCSGSDEQAGLIPTLIVYFLQKTVFPLESCWSWFLIHRRFLAFCSSSLVRNADQIEIPNLSNRKHDHKLTNLIVFIVSLKTCLWSWHMSINLARKNSLKKAVL